MNMSNECSERAIGLEAAELMMVRETWCVILDTTICFSRILNFVLGFSRFKSITK
jgi:hypothetical protein